MQSQLYPTPSHNSKRNYAVNREHPNEVDSDDLIAQVNVADIQNCFKYALKSSLSFGTPSAHSFRGGGA